MMIHVIFEACIELRRFKFTSTVKLLERPPFCMVTPLLRSLRSKSCKISVKEFSTVSNGHFSLTAILQSNYRWPLKRSKTVVPKTLLQSVISNLCLTKLTTQTFIVKHQNPKVAKGDSALDASKLYYIGKNYFHLCEIKQTKSPSDILFIFRNQCSVLCLI